MNEPAPIVVLFVTAPPDAADRIVSTLVDERLVACGNIVPGVSSVYRWKGQVCRDTEAIVFMETPVAHKAAAIARLRELHPYEVPKIVELAPSSVNADYLQWAWAATDPTATD